LIFCFKVIGKTYQEHKAYEGAAFEENIAGNYAKDNGILNIDFLF